MTNMHIFERVFDLIENVDPVVLISLAALFVVYVSLKVVLRVIRHRH
jgi:hypothetical protein